MNVDYADIGSCLHTVMRKFLSSDVSAIVWNFIHMDAANDAWEIILKDISKEFEELELDPEDPDSVKDEQIAKVLRYAWIENYNPFDAKREETILRVAGRGFDQENDWLGFANCLREWVIES